MASKILMPLTLLRHLNYNYNEIHMYYECIIYKVQILFTQILIIIKALCPAVREALWAGRMKLFVEGWDLFTHAAFQLAVFRKVVPTECIHQGPKYGNPRVLNLGWRKY
jgi:hypothetical protein